MYAKWGNKEYGVDSEDRAVSFPVRKGLRSVLW